MKKIILFALFISVFACVKISHAQVTISGSNGADGIYATLTTAGGAFSAINSANQAGANIVVTITADLTNETGAVRLNAGNWTSLTIVPSGNRIITGNPSDPIIYLNGADNVIINGLNDGTNSLTISNTYTSVHSAVDDSPTCAVFFANDATNNTITNCNLQGSSVVSYFEYALGGVVVFGGTNATTGNDNNVISYCNIGSAGTNLPARGIYSYGTSGKENSNNTIQYCNIYDYYYSGDNYSTGLYLYYYNTDWTIANNKFYQTAARTYKSSHSAIRINNTGNNYQIYNNTIGYSNSSGSGTYTMQSTYSLTKFYGIYLSLGTTTASSVYNNTISNIANTGSVYMEFYGIYAYAGKINIGNSTSGGNVVKNISGNIYYMYGICSDITSPTTNNIENNLIQDCYTTYTGTSYVYGIYQKSGNIRKNKIISIGSNQTMGAANIYGIYNLGPNSTITNEISNNMISLSGGTFNNPTIYGYYDASPPTPSYDFYFNSINIYGNANTTNKTYAFYRANAATYRVKNNIIANRKAEGGSGVKNYAIYIPVTGNLTSDYNTIYSSSTGTNYTGYYASDKQTFASWQNLFGNDINSNNVNPDFISNNDLHLNTNNVGNGVTISGINTDIDGDIRPDPPTKGADEISQSSCIAVAVVTHPATPAPVCSGNGIINLTVEVSGNIPYNYQWQVNTGSGWSNLTNGGVYGNTAVTNGSTSNTHTLTITNPDVSYNNYQYRCYITNCNGTQSALTNAVSISVSSFIPLAITTHPGNAEACEGGNAQFSIIAEGTSISYQWQVSTDGGNNFSDITSAGNNPVYAGWNSSQLLLSGITSSNNGYRYRCVANGSCSSPVTSNSAVLTVTESIPVSISITANPSGAICEGTLVNFTATAINGGTSPVYEWLVNGNPVGGNSSTFSSATLAMNDQVLCRLTSSHQCASNNPANSNTIVMIVKPSLTPSIQISTPNNPVCSHTLVNFFAEYQNGGTSPQFQWYVNGQPVGTNSSTYSSNNLSDGDVVKCRLTSNEACVVNNPAYSNEITMIIGSLPVAIAGDDTTYTGTPIQIGNPLNGPGNISWLPVDGLNNPTSPNPLASPTSTVTYTLTVDNNGCVATDEVTITVGGINYTITGKTMYAGKVTAGSAPNPPSYAQMKYNIDNVIVILKNQMGDEIARDTSDASGNFTITDVNNGTYTLYYDKFAADTMLWVNDVNAIDVALIKYYVGADNQSDLSRNFLKIYKKAANVDNNGAVNSIDVARIKAKLGSPYDPAKNFPKGNWVNLDTTITVADDNLNIILPVISYGDYNASSSKYRDSVALWTQAKSLTPDNIIAISEETITYSGTEAIEVPLRISGKVKDFSALGLELTYPNNDFKLVGACMHKAGKNTPAVKINPSLDEIIADNNDLLVTEHEGVIRIVYATTNHFDVDANEQVLKLIFKSTIPLPEGETNLMLKGTGVIGDQYGRDYEDIYLLQPRILIQHSGQDVLTGITVFPNPASDKVNIICNENIVKMELYDIAGQKLFETQPNTNETEINLKDLPAAMYFLKINGSMMKLIKN